MKAAVLGASGFGGAELIRLLSQHPAIEVIAASAERNVGLDISEVHPWMSSWSSLELLTHQKALEAGVDIVFCSLPHGASEELFATSPDPMWVDLAGDFRLSAPDWIYGATELHRDLVSQARRVANPGCYAAAALLALAPAVRAGLTTGAVEVVGLSGVSGAGRASGSDYSFSSVTGSIRPYAVTGHQHIGEMELQLSLLAGESVGVGFVPHLIPTQRGIVTTCVARTDGEVSEEEIRSVYEAAYAHEPFVDFLGDERLPDTARVAGTNLAEVAVRLDDRLGRLIATSAIDNLVKGAAGQAIQNANVMLGIPESSGLQLTPVLP